VTGDIYAWKFLIELEPLPLLFLRLTFFEEDRAGYRPIRSADCKKRRLRICTVAQVTSARYNIIASKVVC